MGARQTLGMALSAAAVAAVGAIGVWMGLAATTVPTVDIGETVSDTVIVSTGTEDSGPAVEWRLRRDGTVVVTAALAAPPIALPPDFPLADQAEVAIELSCDARLRDPDVPAGVEVIEDGSEDECTDATGEDLPARQIFVMILGDELLEIRGHPVRDWSTAMAGQSTARSPRMIFATGDAIDPALPFWATTPGKYSSLTSVLEAGPRDLLDLTVTPSGDVVEATSVMVQQDDGSEWVDSVAWTLTYQGYTQQFSLEEGLARWTDPSGQTFMQLLLLLSGALIGVAASLAVERLFSWTLQVRAERPPNHDADGDR